MQKAKKIKIEFKFSYFSIENVCTQLHADLKKSRIFETSSNIIIITISDMESTLEV